jgi:hypothetical protein
MRRQHRAQRTLAIKFGSRLTPPDAQPLPITSSDIADRKYTHRAQAGLDYILSCYGYSVTVNGYDIMNHPSFEDFARGVMASEHAPDFVKNDGELRKRYPPRPLPGLNAGNCWRRPKSGRAL